MPIASVSLPVPASGDGLAVSVASLVEAKTVILSGLFRGSYTILANHAGGAFAPVLLFNSDGTEEIRQTISGAFSEMLVRSNAGTAQATPVTVAVAALQKPGANLFTTLATLSAGFSGLSPIIDLAALFPPTGLENDINIICLGGFEGTITVLGSNDGFSFNPLGTFSASPAQKNFFGLAPVLEFAPLFTSDLVRYIRIDVRGRILSPTVLTIGGAIFNTLVNTDTLSGAYNNGTVPADQTLSLTDAHGGGVVILGSGLMFTGANSFAIQAPLGGQVLFPRVGGISIVSQISTPATTISSWNEVDFKSSILVLTGPPAAIAALAMSHIGQGIINAVGSTVADAYDLKIDAAPAGLVSITRSWSLGTAGAVQISAGGLVLGALLSPPGENDLVLGAGATIVSQVNSGRLGYELAGQRFMVSANGGAYVPLLTGPAPGLTPGSVVFAGPSGALDEDNADFFWDNPGKRLGVDVAASPTAKIHVGGSATGAPGTGSLKLDPGVLLLAPESGVIESDGTHLYWTDSVGTRVELDNGAVATTLADAYANGTISADQTFDILDANGGAVVVNGTTPGIVSPTVFEIDVIGGAINFYTRGGFDVFSSISKGAIAGTAWDAVALLSSTLTLTGGPAVVTKVAQVRVGAAVVNGAGNTVFDAYDLLIDEAPTGTATLTRSWSLGVAGAVQVGIGLVLGGGLLPPTENDLVAGVGATVVSEANTGRLGYRLGTQQFFVSCNGAAYVPLLTGPAAGGFTQGSVPFGSATGTLAEDNAQLFWDDTNKYLGVGTNVVGSRLVVAGGTYADAGGVRDNAIVTGTFAPVGGTAAYDNLNLSYVVDQTGGANGRVVGLMIVATETAVVGAHYPIDVFGGAGGVTELFRVVNDGSVSVKKGLALGIGLAAPGESDLAVENGATIVSEANTGRLGYQTGTQQFFVSMNGTAYVPLLVGPAVGGFTQGSVPFGSATGALAQDNAKFFWDDTNFRLGVGVTPPTATLHIVQPVVNAAIPTAFLLVGGALTNITASAEDVGVNFNLSATKTWATGAIATQREVVFQAPTYAFNAASTITTAATVTITGAPIIGANATITNPLAFWVQGGSSQFIATQSVVSAAGAKWDGLSVGASTLTLTGATTPVTELSLVALKVPTISAASAITVTTAATMTIAGAPVGAGAGPATLTSSLSLWVKDDRSLFSSTTATENIITINNNAGNDAGLRLTINGAAKTTLGSRIGTTFLQSSGAIGFGTNAMGLSSSQRMLISATGNVAIGAALFPAAASVLHVVADQATVVAAAGAVWNGINFAAPQLTLSGATSPITSLNFFLIASPTINAASAVVTTDFFTCRIGAATFAGAGPASATRNWSLGIDGSTKFGGGIEVHGTDVNVAGPYTILATDYYLQVRRTATAAISLNLPSIAVVGNGFTIMAKDSGYNAAVNNITWVRNGADTVENVAGSYIQNVTGSLIVFVANATTNNWELS